MVHSFERRAVIVTFPDTATHTETYGFAGTSGNVNLEGQFLIPKDLASKTVFIFMHPSSTLNLLPMPKALAEAGMHVLCAASRYPKNDSALILEKTVIDMGAWVKYAREQAGYESVILVGWSGGGSLSVFYQAEAENPSITATPAGDPVDLAGAKLQPADAVILIAAHMSRAETLTEWIDPSVLNELDPDQRDRELDIYADDAPHQPPYSADFVQKFRSAQVARNRKITAWAQDKLETLRRRKSVEIEFPFVVHRTMCDVRWLDPAVDPNERKPRWSYLGPPAQANVLPAGLGRYSSLRSWISQWSYDLSNGRSRVNAPRIRKTSVLMIENNADDAVPATHNPTVFGLLGTPDKEHVIIRGATHYYLGQPDHLAQCIGTVRDWCARKGFSV